LQKTISNSNRLPPSGRTEITVFYYPLFSLKAGYSVPSFRLIAGLYAPPSEAARLHGEWGGLRYAVT